MTTHEDKAGAFFEFYEGLLGFAKGREAMMDLNALGVPTHDLNALYVPFFDEEVLETIKTLSSDKSPSPNGFTDRFYEACCPIIKTNLLAVLSCVWAQKFRNMGLLNSVYINLQPKVENASHIKDFRPISLVHSFANIVIKLLVNRLASWLQFMVSPKLDRFH